MVFEIPRDRILQRCRSEITTGFKLYDSMAHTARNNASCAGYLMDTHRETYHYSAVSAASSSG